MRECQAHVCAPHRHNTHASYLSKLTVILINLQVPFDTLMYESRLTVRVFGSIRGQCIWPERQRAGAVAVVVVRPRQGEGWKALVVGKGQCTCHVRPNRLAPKFKLYRTWIEPFAWGVFQAAATNHHHHLHHHHYRLRRFANTRTFVLTFVNEPHAKYNEDTDELFNRHEQTDTK